MFFLLLLSLFSQPFEDRETIQRSFPSATKLLVDNINGFHPRHRYPRQ